MTLFKLAEPNNEIFDKVLKKFFNGCEDEWTLRILSQRDGCQEDLSINPFEMGFD